MNALQKHDPASNDLTVDHAVTMPSDIRIADLSNTNDLRGHEPPPETDKEADNTKMIIGAAVVAIVIGGLGAFTYTSGLWNATPPASPVVASNSASPAVATPAAVVAPAPPIVAPPQTVIPAATPLQAAPPLRTHAPIIKRQATPAVNTVPRSAVIPPVTAPVESAPLTNSTVTPVESTPIAPMPQPAEPTQALPDQPATPPPAQSPSSPQPSQ